MRAFVGSLAVGVACVLSACATDAYRPLPALRAVQSATALGDGVDVTMYNLITTPERYDGKVVHVIGVGRFEEGFGNENVWALYPTRDDLDHMTCALVYGLAGVVESAGPVSVAKIQGATREQASVRLADGTLILAYVVSGGPLSEGDRVLLLKANRPLGGPVYQVVGKDSQH